MGLLRLMIFNLATLLRVPGINNTDVAKQLANNSKYDVFDLQTIFRQFVIYTVVKQNLSLYYNILPLNHILKAKFLTVDWFVLYVAPFGVLLPVIAGIIYYKYLDNPQKVVLWYVIYSGLSNAVSIYTARVLHQKTVIIFTLSSIVWFAFISYFYVLLFKGKSKKIIYPLIFIIALLSVGNLLFYQSTNVFNTYTTSLNAAVIIIYAMIYVYRQNMTDIDVSWGNNSVNWINAGFLLYYSTALVMYISYSFITTRAFGALAWGIHNIVLIIMYILFIIGFKKCKA